jgi:hypothetical protein
LKCNLPIKKKVNVGSIIKERIFKWYLFSWAVPRARRNRIKFLVQLALNTLQRSNRLFKEYTTAYGEEWKLLTFS